MTPDIAIVLIIATLVTFAAAWAWKSLVTTIIVPMEHCCVHIRDGRFAGLLDPGKHRFVFGTHQFRMLDTRLQPVVLQPQEINTREGIAVKATVAGSFRISDPVLAVSSTADFASALYTMIQLALRDAIGGVEVENLLPETRVIGTRMQDAVRPRAAAIGLELTDLAVRDVILPADIRLALSESWRSRKAALAELENARGKVAAARTLANAAKLHESHPALAQVRYLEAIEAAAKNNGNTLVLDLTNIRI